MCHKHETGPASNAEALPVAIRSHSSCSHSIRSHSSCSHSYDDDDFQSGFEAPVEHGVPNSGSGIWGLSNACGHLRGSCESCAQGRVQTCGFRCRLPQRSARAIRKVSSSIPRSEIFFTSKIPPGQLGYGNTKATVEASLKTTGFDYIDLVLIHAPYGGSANRKGAWKALIEAQEAGKVRSIGVSNYGVHHLDELETHIRDLEEERGGPGRGGKISVGQWELHPWLQRKDIVSWCTERGIVLQAYCPIVRGKKFGDEKLVKLAKKHGKTPAQVLLRWSLQKGFVPLPKSVTKSRIEENADLYDFELTEEEVDSLSSDAYEPCAWDPTTSSLES